jgi:hypothetical protein
MGEKKPFIPTSSFPDMLSTNQPCIKSMVPMIKLERMTGQ